MKRFSLIIINIVILTSNLTLAATQEELARQYSELDELSPNLSVAFKATERETLLRSVSRNKVAALSAVSHYDLTGDVGFCFGRAMTGHLIARQRGLIATSIRKLFIIGDLRSSDSPQWRFHVTTLVRSQEDGEWYAIDPIMRPPISEAKPLLARDWVTTVRRVWDKHNRAKLYLTSPNAIMPDMRVLPVAEAETGERIIEIAFNPEGKTGFSPHSLGAHLAYDLDPEAEDAYFQTTLEPENDQFHFLRLEMTILKPQSSTLRIFDFNGYFADLFENLASGALELESDAPSAISRTANDLHSLRIN